MCLHMKNICLEIFISSGKKFDGHYKYILFVRVVCFGGRWSALENYTSRSMTNPFLLFMNSLRLFLDVFVPTNPHSIMMKKSHSRNVRKTTFWVCLWNVQTPANYQSNNSFRFVSIQKCFKWNSNKRLSFARVCTSIVTRDIHSGSNNLFPMTLN